ncbi:MAG: hypothetical protein NW241_08790 [Bacteroidia bacterium]|nr:hypothetical protein [Bacteroidia bacterium]
MKHLPNTALLGRWLLPAALLWLSGCRNEAPAPDAQFEWIFQDKSYINYQSVDIQPTPDDGYIILATQGPAPYLLRLDSAGRQKWQSDVAADGLNAYISPAGQILVRPGGYFFLCQHQASGDIALVKVPEAASGGRREAVEIRRIRAQDMVDASAGGCDPGDINNASQFVLSSTYADGSTHLVALGEDINSNVSFTLRTDTSGVIEWSFCDRYTDLAELGSPGFARNLSFVSYLDLDSECCYVTSSFSGNGILTRLIDRNGFEQFSIQPSEGAYLASALFGESRARDTTDIRLALALHSEEFIQLLHLSPQDTAYLSEIDTDFRIRIETDNTSRLFYNLLASKPVYILPLLTETAPGFEEQAVLFGATTQNNQIALQAFQGSGPLESLLLGAGNPYEINALRAAPQGGIIVLGTTRVGGLFSRICVFRIPGPAIAALLEP